MKKIFLKKLGFLLLSLQIVLILFVIDINEVSARSTDDFKHDVNIVYTANSDSSAEVSFNFITTNKVSNNYLRNFRLELPFKPLSHKVDKSPTPIEIKAVNKSNNKNTYNVDIDILSPVYGLDQAFKWRVDFKVRNFVIPHGMQKAIILPTFTRDGSNVRYKSVVRVNKKLGDVKAIYNGGKVKSDDDFHIIELEKADISNYVILLGNVQEYSFISKKSDEKKEIYIPLENEYQEVFYKQFPRDSDLNLDSLVQRNGVKANVSRGEQVEGIVKLTQGEDREYEEVFEEVEYEDYLKKITIEVGELSKADLVQRFLQNLSKKIEVVDYITNIDSKIEINTDDTTLNPLELNKILREFLSMNKIESRGVFGYVYPIQIVQNESQNVEPHIWSEFWDGEKWVSVDPTWFITSGGNNYIGKNFYHHIKFGDYTGIDAFNKFITKMDGLNVTPLKRESSTLEEVKVNLLAFDKATINKTFEVMVESKSNKPIMLNTIEVNFNSSDRNLSFDKSKHEVNTVLMPNEQRRFSFGIDYRYILKTVSEDVSVKIEYTSKPNSEPIFKSFKHNIFIKSNLTKYLTNVYVGVISVVLFGMLLFLLLSNRLTVNL